MAAPTLLEGSLWDFTLTTPESKPWVLSELKGSTKAVLLVNTASQCGYTPQIGPLGDLYREYKDRGLLVIGVPSNDFGSQEPLASNEIPDFCRIDFGASFPLSGKVPQKHSFMSSFRKNSSFVLPTINIY
jgi:glutathione peroxidase